MRISTVLLCALLVAAGVPLALQAQQSEGTGQVAAKKQAQKKKPVPKVAKARVTPAKELFGAAKVPAALAPKSIGFYAKGCLAGGKALPVDGPAWEVMRLSRNRNWGHPELIALVEKLAVEAREHDGWPGLLVGDLSQPRGGPMLSGHASHQVGLDADIWLTPMPNRRLSDKEREEISATSMLAADRISVDPQIWKPEHARLIKRAASYPKVERIFVHPAIKKALCEFAAKDTDRAWLAKVRPYWGHYYHFHIRIHCPEGSTNCEKQPEPATDDGCGAELTHWLNIMKVPPKPEPAQPAKPGVALAELPAECRAVLTSGPDGVVIPTSADPAKPSADKTKTAAPNKSAEKK